MFSSGWTAHFPNLALPSSPRPTFSFIFSIFFTELLRCGRSSWPYLSRAELMSLALPMCFSSCLSASFSLFSALRLSVWYMWYVFITCHSIHFIHKKELKIKSRKPLAGMERTKNTRTAEIGKVCQWCNLNLEITAEDQLLAFKLLACTQTNTC